MEKKLFISYVQMAKKMVIFYMFKKEYIKAFYENLVA